MPMAHNNYYLDLCVDTYIVYKNKVLLRFHDKYHYWGTCGGHIDPGQDPNEAALREVFEEAGLVVELVGPEGWEKRDEEKQVDLVPPFFVNRHAINEHHEHCAFVFVAKTSSNSIQPTTQEDEGARFKWCTLDDLDRMVDTQELRNDVYRYASTALKRLG